MEIVFLTHLDTLPFMDTTGTFAYQYTMVSKMNMSTSKGHVLRSIPDSKSTSYAEYENFASEAEERFPQHLRCKRNLVGKIPELNTSMTLYQSGDKFQMMQDNTTATKYKIKGCTTFREMPFYDLQ
jgi:hypothetical protein